MATIAIKEAAQVDNALASYYDQIEQAAALCNARRAAHGGDGFHPGFVLPPLDGGLIELFAPSRMALGELPAYRGRRLRLLNLMGNPSTRTTKTFASLLMVARAIHAINRDGQGVLIVTPTSANKGTALRDAVLRALKLGLADPSLLRIVTIAPESSLAKLWSSQLSEDPELRARNPVVLLRGDDPGAVKPAAVAVAEALRGVFQDDHRLRIWQTLDLDNYRIADAARAFFEDEQFPLGASTRLHAHAVSSAYGLLGYRLGREVLTGGVRDSGRPPGLFLVQHLGAPDMVLSLRSGSFSRTGLPAYSQDRSAGLYCQDTDPAFPSATYALEETLDGTFYTHRPATSDLVDPVVREDGGGGIVVSLYECLARYGEIRQLVDEAGVALPADPRRLREWALTMVCAGVLNAIDRDLISPEAEVVIHASGSYSEGDFTPFDRSHAATASRVDEIVGLLLAHGVAS